MRNQESIREIIVDALHSWGTWRGGKGNAHGNGGATDAGPRGGARPSDEHSDPVFWEYVRTQKDGQGLNQFLDCRIREQRQPMPRILMARYAMLYSFDVIAKALTIERPTLLAMHDNFIRTLETPLERYAKTVKNDHSAKEYKWRVSRATA